MTAPLGEAISSLHINNSSGPSSVPPEALLHHQSKHHHQSLSYHQEPKSLPPLGHHPKQQQQQQQSPLQQDPYFCLQTKFLETRQSLKDARRKSREQSRKARQLLAAVASKIDEKEGEMERVGWKNAHFNHQFRVVTTYNINERLFQLRSVHNAELSAICQQLLSLQSSMAKEKTRVQDIMEQKEKLITTQRTEIERLNNLIKGTSSNSKILADECKSGNVVVTSSTSGVVTTLDRHRPAIGGATRVHGSFRQYKREQKSQRQHQGQPTSSSSSKSKSSSTAPSSSSDLGSLGSTSLSSEENSSPNMTPKNSRPALRLSLSAGAVTLPTPQSSAAVGSRTRGSLSSSSSASSTSYNSLSYPKKGILKTCSSYGSLDSSAAASMLENLSKLIDNKAKKICEEKSDSGRESEEMDEQNVNGSISSHHHIHHKQPSSLPPITVNKMKMPSPPPVPPKKTTTTSAGSSNSSFDDSGICLTSSTTRLSIRGKEKPKPPPRSSTTRLTSSMRKPNHIPPLLATVDKSGENNNATIVTISGHQPDEEKKKAVKKVKFNPEVSTSGETRVDDTMEKKAIKLLEESIHNFNPAQQKQDELRKKQMEKAKKLRQEMEEAAVGRRIEDCVSYYEPYI